jgi:superfamily II DNA or RNA helicase
MGLTATLEREDGLHSELTRLVGGKVFEKRVKDLTGTHLSSFRIEKIAVELTDEEQEEYEKNQKVFSDYLVVYVTQ